MEAEKDEKLGSNRFVCKFCNKKYPCGKSLGGHLRSHRIAGAAAYNQKRDRTQFQNHQNATPRPVKISPLSLTHQASASYILRENPKKTQRFADSGGRAGAGGGERLCKECGKGFPSMKALCGHMACHSEKVTAMSKLGTDNDDHGDGGEGQFSNFDQKKLKVKVKKQVVVMEDDDGSEESDDTKTSSATPRRGKRSKRLLRYKNLNFNKNNCFGSSSSVSSDIEQEQEEVARCLMMLSVDSFGHGIKGLLSSFNDHSSDTTNSVVLEPKSSHVADDTKKTNSDSQVHAKRDYDDTDHKSGFRFESFDAELEKKGGKQLMKQIIKTGSSLSSSVRGFGHQDQYFWEIDASIDDGSNKFAMKRSNYNNQKINHGYGCSESICESGENSIEADSISVPISKASKVSKFFISKAKVKNKNPIDHQSLCTKAKKRLGTKKIKGHECPICFRVFKSGQALGGHKRSHFLGGCDDRTVLVLSRQQQQQQQRRQCPEFSGLLDLNLPAPEDSGGGGHAGFMAK